VNDKIALLIGHHILEAYNQWTENPKGKAIIIPFEIPNRKSNEPPWCMNIQCEMPWFVEVYYEKGERKHRHWSLKEWYEKRGGECVSGGGE